MRSLLVLLAFLLLAPAADAAWRAPCGDGGPPTPQCTWWTAKVTLVADGDTVKADIAGVGAKQVRLTGINAMELTRYSHTAARRRGACHGVEATAFAERLIKRSRWKVRLAAQHPGSRSGRRLRRSVWVKSGGRWVDVARAELAAGHALWMPNTDEWQHNADYAAVAARALQAKRNLYDPAGCGAGPAAGQTLGVAVNWDADGADETNLNGEFVDVYNGGETPLDLSGWWVRDSALRFGAGRTPGHRFPPGTVVGPGLALRLHVGCGRPDGLDVFWCEKETVFENVEPGKGAGDGAYLFDPRGNLRAGSLYPCLLDCPDALGSSASMTVHASDPEYVTIRNTGRLAIDLVGHALKLRNHGKPDQYVFSDVFQLGSVILPGGSYTWRPQEPNRLSDNGGVIELRSLTNVLSDCVAWGFGRC